jgi:hypothetical protein
MKFSAHFVAALALLFTAFHGMSGQSTSAQSTSAPTAASTPVIPQNPRITRQVQAGYGKLPLTFEANRGQTDPSVKFLAHGSGYSVYLTAGQMVLSLRATSPTNPPTKSPTNSFTKIAPSSTKNAIIQLNLVGANQNPAVTGEQLQPGKVNYFIGNDRKKWQTNVPLYKQVRYASIYPGIDLIYYGNQGRVEHDFVVAPGADPRQIQLEVKGADRLSLADNGDLVMHVAEREIHLQAPTLYQEFHGLQVPVTGQYKLQSATRVAFALGPYDKTMPLVIDPVLAYGTFLGGLGDDEASAIAVDSLGSAYVTGYTDSPNFPLASQSSPAPFGANVFLAKLDVSGSSLIYADYIGGNSDDFATALVLDSSDDVFLTGTTYSSDFPTTEITYQSSNNTEGNQTAFVTEVSPDGSTLLYSTYLGGSYQDGGTGIGLDGSGNIYVAGWTWSLDFPVSSGAYQTAAGENQEEYYGEYGFVTAIASNGASLIYSTYFAGSTNIVQDCYYGPCWPDPISSVSGIAVDASGNVYVAGNTNTYNFPTTTGAYETTNATNYDNQVGFVGKFSSSGSLTYSTYFNAVAANSYFELNGIAVDSSGSVYLVGNDYAEVIPVSTPNLCNPAESETGCTFGFLAKLDPTFSTLTYATYLSPNIDFEPSSVLVDSSGDAYVMGISGGGDVGLFVNPVEAYTNEEDIVLMEVDPTGGTQLFGTFLGGYGEDYPGGIAIDSSGAIYATGYTNSSDFPVTAAALQNTEGGNYDAFISKIGTAADPAVAVAPSLIQFSIRPVGSVSQPNTSLLRNMGSAPLTISSLTITGDFSETNTCGSSVAAAGTCTFTVTFTPTAPGPRFGSIMIEDNAAGSPHFINLVGNGATAVADFTASSLTFPSLEIGITSSAQSVTLTNNGNATMTISDISITGDYAQTNNCPGSLGIASSCTFQITFTPTAGGARNGTLTITDNAPGSPQSITLTGSGYVTTATVAPASLSFGNENVGTTSASQSVVVTNTGVDAMTVSSIVMSAGFAETDNCTSSSIQASGTCTIHVTFSPTAGGSLTGTMTINDNAQGNPHLVTLSGTGLVGIAQLSESGLTFASASVGTTSSAQTITITNSGNGPLTITSVQATGDFAETNNCTSVNASGTCTIQVTFTPTASGSRTGTLTIADSALNSPQTVTLNGSGIDFSVAPPSSASSSVQPGGMATYQISVAPIGGTFSSAITLACEGAPAFSTCTLSPTSVTPGATTATVNVSIQTGSGTATTQSAKHIRPSAFLWTLTPGFGLFGMLLIGARGTRRRKSIYFLSLMLIVTLALLLWTGCGSTKTVTTTVQNTQTPAGTYTILVIGTSGSVQHFTSLTLTVQ